MTIALGSTDATLLDGVNYVLEKAKLIQGDSGLLTTLTDSPRQVWIDNAILAWNEIVEELFSVTDLPMPKELAENTITLVASTRAYALATDVNVLHFPFMDETNGQFIYEYQGTYLDMVYGQPIPSDYTGLPNYGVIRPTDGYLYLDRIPTSSEAGLVYKYRYDKDVSLSAFDDTFPFENDVFRSLVPAVAEMFNYYTKREFSDAIYNMSMGRAARKLKQIPERKSYGKSRIHGDLGLMQPFD